MQQLPQTTDSNTTSSSFSLYVCGGFGKYLMRCVIWFCTNFLALFKHQM